MRAKDHVHGIELEMKRHRDFLNPTHARKRSKLVGDLFFHEPKVSNRKPVAHEQPEFRIDELFRDLQRMLEKLRDDLDGSLNRGLLLRKSGEREELGLLT